MSNTRVSTKFDPVNCNYTLWSFDHCGCSLTLEWDKSTRDNPIGVSREHRPVDPSVVIIGSSGGPELHHIKCADHAHLTDTKEHYDVVTEENWRKSDVQNIIGKQIVSYWWEGKAPGRILYIAEPSLPESPTHSELFLNTELSRCNTHSNYPHGKVILHS